MLMEERGAARQILRRVVFEQRSDDRALGKRRDLRERIARPGSSGGSAEP